MHIHSRRVQWVLMIPKWYFTSFCDKKCLKKLRKTWNFRCLKNGPFWPVFSHFFISDPFKCIIQLCLQKIIFFLGLWVSENVFNFYIPQKMTPGDVLKGVKIGYFSFYVFVNFFRHFLWQKDVWYHFGIRRTYWTHQEGIGINSSNFWKS